MPFAAGIEICRLFDKNRDVENEIKFNLAKAKYSRSK